MRNHMNICTGLILFYMSHILHGMNSPAVIKWSCGIFAAILVVAGLFETNKAEKERD